MSTIYNNRLERRTPLKKTGKKSIRAPRGTGKLTRKCRVCGKMFKAWPYRIRAGVLCCSNKCRGVLQRARQPRTCRNCDNEFTFKPSQLRHYKGAGKYCSRACSYEGTIKATAGKPIKDKYGRSNRKADQEWKFAVRIRDNYTCQRCGKFEQYIHAHHVAPRSQRPDLRHAVSNGKCLCNSCHSWVHEHPIEARTLGLLDGETYELARKKLKGQEHPSARLTETDVRVIRTRHDQGENAQSLASEFQVVKHHIYAIVSRRAWRHI